MEDRNEMVTAQYMPGLLDANLCKNKQKQTINNAFFIIILLRASKVASPTFDRLLAKTG